MISDGALEFDAVQVQPQVSTLRLRLTSGTVSLFVASDRASHRVAAPDAGNGTAFRSTGRSVGRTGAPAVLVVPGGWSITRAGAR